jgi:hypothetical protein
MESGKTTLGAGLVRSGMRYLTDEATVLDLDADLVRPYPKPLTLERGSWEVLADLAPAPVSHLGDQWFVGPRAIRPDAVADACPVGLVISPAYRPGQPTRLEPLRRVETVAVLVENSFNFARFGRRGLEGLATLARRCDGYRLVSGDLVSAVDAVFGLVGSEAGCQPR